MNADNNIDDESSIDDSDDAIIMIDEDGNEVQFVAVEVFDYNSKRYAMLARIDGPENDSESEGCVVRVESSDDDDSDIIVAIDDDKEWNEVVAHYQSLYSEEE